MCRKTGLDSKRRCDWLSGAKDLPARPVWARGHVSTFSCPKSVISAESQSLVEEYLVRRRMGGVRLDDLNARQAEAFLILEKEIQAEKTNGQHNARHALEDIFGDRR